MSFLNPALLFGLTAIAVPIIIHLLNRRKFQKVVWAAMRFLKTSVEQNQRRMRIEDLLLLALRCLLLVLLALALARPALKSAASEVFGAKVTGVLILDHSYSMSQGDGVVSRFDLARKAAEEALANLPSGSALALFLASDVVHAVIPEPTHDANLVRKVIREARLCDRPTDLLPALRRAVELLRARNALRKEVFLITDRQALGWRQLPEIKKVLEDARKEHLPVRLVFVGDTEERNLGLSRLRLASGLTPLNQPLRFEAQVSNYGREEAKSIKVSLHVNADPPMDEAVIDVLPGGASKSVSLFAKLRTEAFHAVTARIAEDRLPADDKRTVAVRAIKEVRVLLVDGDPGREPRDSQVFFLRHALQPVAAAEAAQYFIKTLTITTPELTTTRFDDFDAVVLANVTELPVASLAALELFLRRGGGLMIFPGQNIHTGFYNDSLLKQYEFLPAALGPLRGEAEKEDQYFTLQDKDYAHPIVEIWSDPGSGTLASARFYRAFELVPAPWKAEIQKPAAPPPGGRLPDAGEPKVILRYSDGKPAVMERSWGLGRVVLFSSTANTAWNDLPVRPAFVPLVHRVTGAIVQRQDEGLTVRVGDQFIYRLNNEQMGRDVVVLPPGYTRNSPRDLRRVELVNGLPTLQYDGTDYNGAYEASISGDLQRVIKFAAQPDPAESSLEELGAAPFNALAQVAQVVRWKPGVSLRELVDKERFGTELWLPIVVAALALALLESFLAQWFSRTK